MRQPAAAMIFMEALQHELRNTAGWRPSATFWRAPADEDGHYSFTFAHGLRRQKRVRRNTRRRQGHQLGRPRGICLE
jgi:hypothetical protein